MPTTCGPQQEAGTQPPGLVERLACAAKRQCRWRGRRPPPPPWPLLPGPPGPRGGLPIDPHHCWRRPPIGRWHLGLGRHRLQPPTCRRRAIPAVPELLCHRLRGWQRAQPHQGPNQGPGLVHLHVERNARRFQGQPREVRRNPQGQGNQQAVREAFGLERISATVPQTGWRFPTTAEVPPRSAQAVGSQSVCQPSRQICRPSIKTQDEMTGSLLDVKA